MLVAGSIVFARLQNLDQTAPLFSLAGVRDTGMGVAGHWNDPDMLQVTQPRRCSNAFRASSCCSVLFASVGVRLI
jgi:hypothetical protein